MSSLSTKAPPPPSGKPRLALLQILAGNDKLKNLETAQLAIAKAASDGANIIALPECFNSPYATDQFPIYAEPMPASMEAIDPAVHPSTAMLSGAAAKHGIFLVGGAFSDSAAFASR